MKQAKDFYLVTKAQQLCEYTIRLTSNCDKFPKKYRFTVSDRMQRVSMDIYEFLLDANRTPLTNAERREGLQSEAVNSCDKLLFYINMCVKLRIISMSSAEFWSKLVSDIKYMTIGWKTKDEERRSAQATRCNS